MKSSRDHTAGSVRFGIAPPPDTDWILIDTEGVHEIAYGFRVRLESIDVPLSPEAVPVPPDWQAPATVGAVVEPWLASFYDARLEALFQHGLFRRAHGLALFLQVAGELVDRLEG